jgi:integrase
MVSRLFLLGADIKYVQAECGHSSAQVTMDTYGHLLPKANNEYAERLAALHVENELSRDEKAQVSGTNG